MDSCQVVSGQELKRLYLYKRIWSLGWVVAAILAAAYVYCLAEIHVLKSAYSELLLIEDKLSIVQEEQAKLTESYVTAWKNQQSTADLLLSWGEADRERKSISLSNKDAVFSRKSP